MSFGDNIYEWGSDPSFDISDPAFYPIDTPDIKEHVFDPTYGGTMPLPKQSWFDKLLSSVKNIGGKAADFAATDRGLFAILGALASAADRAKPSGGGYAKRYVGPTRQLTRTVEQGKYGPIARFAAQGGLMQAYANGGAVRPFPMQDGGFVYTNKAVQNAGGPGGLAALVPSARMISGPGTGTSDSIPAYIQGPNGRTPARVSNGEAYVPPDGQTQQHYALMKQLERRA